MSHRPLAPVALTLATTFGALALLTATTASADPAPSGSATPTTVTATTTAGAATGVDLGIEATGAGALMARGRANPAFFLVTGRTSDASVDLTLPPGAQVSSGSVEGSDVTCDQSGQHAVCDLGPLAVDSSLFVAEVTPAMDAPIGSTITVAAAVSAAEGDPDPDNDTAQKQFTITANSGVRTVVSPDALTVHYRTPATLHIAVTEDAPDPATNVVVVVRGAGNATVVSVGGAGRVAPDPEGGFRVTIAEIASGATVGLDVEVGSLDPSAPNATGSVSVSVVADIDPGTCNVTESCELVTPVTFLPGPAGDPGVTPTTPQLANTGTYGLVSGAVGVALLVIGGALAYLGRRRAV